MYDAPSHKGLGGFGSAGRARMTCLDVFNKWAIKVKQKKVMYYGML